MNLNGTLWQREIRMTSVVKYNKSGCYMNPAECGMHPCLPIGSCTQTSFWRDCNMTGISTEKWNIQTNSSSFICINCHWHILTFLHMVTLMHCIYQHYSRQVVLIKVYMYIYLYDIKTICCMCLSCQWIGFCHVPWRWLQLT